MLFNSYVFIFLFLPIVLGGFHYFRVIKHKYALIWLLLASLFFYGWWNPNYLILIICSMMVNYLCSLQLLKREDGSFRKMVLIFGITFNLLLIGYYKYCGFFVDQFNFLTNGSISLETLILPLGISFFTFQQIAFLIDSYHRTCGAYNIVSYGLFVMFFPQLIAGPIVHPNEIMPQLLSRKITNFNRNYFAVGFTLFIIGLFKKVVIADHLALYATPAFEAVDNHEILTFFEAWCGALAYTFQLYFDFSGYSDMALGLAKLFGIKLPLNFNSPYKAKNIIEFWRRWHMTLSRFLRDYLYIPLGGNKSGVRKRYINLLLTMIIGGLWHGAGWTFIMWGMLHGIYLVINHAFRFIISPFKIESNLFYRSMGWLITFVAVVIGWVFFRSSCIETTVSILKSMSGLNGITADASVLLPRQCIAWILFAGGIAFLAPNAAQLMRHYHPALNAQKQTNILVWRPMIIWAWLIGAMGFIAVLQLGQLSEFLYFQF